MTGSAGPQVAGGAYPQLEPDWVDEVLLAGTPDEDYFPHVGKRSLRSVLSLQQPCTGPQFVLIRPEGVPIRQTKEPGCLVCPEARTEPMDASSIAGPCCQKGSL